MKIRTYGEIARKYGLSTFLPFTEVDGAVAGSMSFIDHSRTTDNAYFGDVFTPAMNVVGNGDWVDIALATTLQQCTDNAAPLPSTGKSVLLLFMFKTNDHPTYANGIISLGDYNTAASACIGYETLSATTGQVVVRDFLGANTVTIPTTEVATSGVKGVAIHVDRTSGTCTVWSGRHSGNSNFTGPSGSADISAVGNLLTTHYFVDAGAGSGAELHPILAILKPDNAPTTAEINNYFDELNGIAFDSHQTRDFNKALSINWAGEAASKNLTNIP